jgi:hypothetical protein
MMRLVPALLALAALLLFPGGPSRGHGPAEARAGETNLIETIVMRTGEDVTGTVRLVEGREYWFEVSGTGSVRQDHDDGSPVTTRVSDGFYIFAGDQWPEGYQEFANLTVYDGFGFGPCGDEITWPAYQDDHTYGFAACAIGGRVSMRSSQLCTTETITCSGPGLTLRIYGEKPLDDDEVAIVAFEGKVEYQPGGAAWEPVTGP